ncbi:MAG: TrkH family potassium uptake protein [Candidatus Schekmanbacteria bacterium]|nr:TrkH family potassium uptake protein [Candidatus Schekmanbacteria bacterium]
MVLRPAPEDFKIIFFNTGRVVVGLAYLMFLPLITAVAFMEWAVAVDFALSIGVTLTIGYLFLLIFHTDRDPQWVHGMSTAAFSWLVCTLVGAIPYCLSGHFASFLDACFDVMSGYTTTGLVLIQNLDHVSYGLNMWRHELTYIGGQGMVVVALTFLVPGFSGAYKMYVGEGKDEKLLPNVIETARAIWLISIVYLCIGTFWLWVGGLIEGLTPLRAFFHALWLYMAAWSTGGFAPQTQNTMYYHSPLIEVFYFIFMVIGSLNFALHYSVWKGNYREVYRNIELRSFAVTASCAFTIACVALTVSNAFPDLLSTFRFTLFHVISAHTTTGGMSVYARQFITHWGPMATIGVILAMAVGGSACSTAGGFKGIRIGIIGKALAQDIKKLVSAESAVVIQKYHHIKDVVLEDTTVRAAALIIFLYIITYSVATAVGAFYGYPMLDAMFDAVSAGSNSGLSCGITAPSMPSLLKVIYLLAMWVGRLEFNAVLVLLGLGYATITGK